MKETYQKIMTFAFVVVAASTIAFGIMINQKLERIVLVAERSEQKLDAAIKAATPVGRAALEKGAKVIRSVDEEDMAESAERGLKEIGEVAKKRLIELLEENNRKLSETNSTALH